MRLSQVVNVTLSAHLPQILRRTRRRRLHLHQSHQKTSYPSQGIEKVPESLRGSAFHEENVRHSPSYVYNTNLDSETEIVHIGRKSQNECAVITMIGDRSQKALWDSVVGRCVISYDCYKSLHPKYKTELFPSSVRIKVANGTFIANKGECDITLKINNEIHIPFPLFGPIVPADDTWP